MLKLKRAWAHAFRFRAKHDTDLATHFGGGICAVFQYAFPGGVTWIRSSMKSCHSSQATKGGGMKRHIASKTCKWSARGGTGEMGSTGRRLPGTSESAYGASGERSETIRGLTQTGIRERMCSTMWIASDFATTRSIGESCPTLYFIVSACRVNRMIGTSGIIRFNW
jgi:hypothetical protein